MNLLGKAAVIGAGSMGSGIAAQFANAGIPVVLLDLVSKEGSRSAVAEAGIARQLRTGGFMHPDVVARVAPGNLEDHLDLIADADWIVEAVVEDEGIKRDLFRRLDAVRKPGSIISSNTSTIRRAQLVRDLGERFDRDFLITHFFNPPRHMQLLEVVAGARTPAATAERARVMADTVLGKTVVDCRDTPGFIANRLGCYWMSVAAIEAIRMGLSVEDADAVMGRTLGLPATGIFGLFDLVGLDLIPKVWGSLYGALDPADAFQHYDLPGEPTIRQMIAEGRIGRKAGAGFYRRSGKGPAQTDDALDLTAMSYRPRRPASQAAAALDLERILAGDTREAQYGWRVLSRLVGYAAEVATEIADDVAAIDVAMQLGYNWKDGPFGLADRISARRIAERFEAEGLPVPDLLIRAAETGGFYSGRNEMLSTTGERRGRAARALNLSDATAGRQPARESDSAVLWDIGDNVACVEFRRKLNVFDESAIGFLLELADWIPGRFHGLIIGTGEGRAFSAGADLAPFIDLVERAPRSDVERFIRHGQNAFSALKYANFPVVAAMSGLALGGGCELLLHCDAVAAHAESMIGLPEAHVGIVPAWGGCTQMMVRALAESGGYAAAASRVFQSLRQGNVARSALAAREHLYLRPADVIVMNPSRVLAEAFSKVLMLAPGYVPPTRPLMTLAGPSGRAALLAMLGGEHAAGRVTDYDRVVGEALATVLTGAAGDPQRPVGEDEIMRLEREANLMLLGRAETRARMHHMLTARKPLRN